MPSISEAMFMFRNEAIRTAVHQLRDVVNAEVAAGRADGLVTCNVTLTHHYFVSVEELALRLHYPKNRASGPRGPNSERKRA